MASPSLPSPLQVLGLRRPQHLSARSAASRARGPGECRARWSTAAAAPPRGARAPGCGPRGGFADAWSAGRTHPIPPRRCDPPARGQPAPEGSGEDDASHERSAEVAVSSRGSVAFSLGVHSSPAPSGCLPVRLPALSCPRHLRCPMWRFKCDIPPVGVGSLAAARRLACAIRQAHAAVA